MNSLEDFEHSLSSKQSGGNTLVFRRHGLVLTQQRLPVTHDHLGAFQKWFRGDTLLELEIPISDYTEACPFYQDPGSMVAEIE